MEIKMTTYTLRQISKSSWQITTGRAKVGFVNACPAGFVARIGQRCEVRPTAKAAFDAVVIPTLGFESKAALAEHNAEVRYSNAAKKVAAGRAVNAMLAGNYDELFDLIGKIEKTNIKKAPW
jgi:hypothetical protein